MVEDRRRNAGGMGSLTGRPIELFTSDDTILIMRRLGTTLAGMLEVTSFDQGVNDTLSGNMTTVARDQTLTLQIDPAGAMTAAFVVTWRGRLVAERYGPGISARTRLAASGMPITVSRRCSVSSRRLSAGRATLRTSTPVTPAMP